MYLRSERVGVVERHYTFLKRLCQVLCALGSQLCYLVVSGPVPCLCCMDDNVVLNRPTVEAAILTELKDWFE